MKIEKGEGGGKGGDVIIVGLLTLLPPIIVPSGLVRWLGGVFFLVAREIGTLFFFCKASV